MRRVARLSSSNHRRWGRWIPWPLVVIALTGQRASAETWFGPPIGFPVPESPTALAVGYLNADGFVDCAVGTRTGDSEKIYVYLNDGLGQFTVSAILPVTNQWNDLDIGDFNGDGRDDIAFCEDPLKIYYADSAHTYPGPSVPVTWPNSGAFQRIVVGDLDGDGCDDLVGRLSESWNVVYILFGSPSGLVTPPVERRVQFQEVSCNPDIWPTSVYDVLLRDIDGDEDLDIVASCEYEHDAFCGVARIGIGYFENQGERTIADSIEWLRNEPGGVDISWEPFDVSHVTNDDLPDCLYRRSDQSIWMINDTGLGEWTEIEVEGVGDGRPYLFDLDGDGESDMIKRTAFTYEVYRGEGAGGFEWIQSIAEPPGWLMVADVDGSPGTEIVGLRSSPNRLVVLPNVSATTTHAPEATFDGRAVIALRPTVTRVGPITINLDRRSNGKERIAAARVIDAGGAERASVDLRLVWGRTYVGELPLAGTWAAGAYWIHVPGSGAPAQRFTIVR